MKITSTFTAGGRPMIMARRGVVTSGHYLATEAGMEILRKGGNAADAAVAVGFCLALTKPHQNGIGGEVPMLVYFSRDRRPWAISGHGTAPRRATLEYFQHLGVTLIPGDGFLPAVVPPMVASYVFLLERFGTMRLADVLTPAIELARDGFGMYTALADGIRNMVQRFKEEWPSSAAVYLRDGQTPELGSRFQQPDWAAMMQRLVDAEVRFTDRADGFKAALDVFYRGEIARRIVDFIQTPIRDASGKSHAGLLTMEDFAVYQPVMEEPTRTTYRGAEVCKCGFWTQGPVLLQALNLLEGYDLAAMGHNSAQYIHTVVECMKLAFADREFHYGDEKFVKVPAERLLSKEYAAARRKLVDAARASMELRPGAPNDSSDSACNASHALQAYPPVTAQSVKDIEAAIAARHGDTTKLEVIDAAGNMVSATPSGGWLHSSPIVPGLGFALGTRGQMFSLQKGHPNCVEPFKRPRSTLTPSLALRDGKPWMSFGSPGGDSQDQWALQFLLNVMDFGMPLQHAVEAPTFWTNHHPSSFHPRAAIPGQLCMEGRIGEEVRQKLAALGHRINVMGDWSGGNTLAAGIDVESGMLSAAASPRLEPAYAAGF